eukprot:TRINITY_DN8740_c0_g1_i1.p1 TRINITY_DN8740_c0_g1~~TRINITY_DN8740_c0_g1_i1.p1  ORF type:complete len:524 (+),score=79.49 TRINITY_DN8740_c0_g1_i1:95-1573(+)
MQGSGGSPRKGLPTVRCCPACQVDYGWAKMTNLNNKGPAAELSKKQLRNALAHYTGRGPAVARRRCEAIGGALFGVARAIEALETGPQRAQASCAHALLELHSVARLLTGPVCSPFCASFSAGSATHTVAGIPCENGDCDGAVSTARTCRPTDVAVDPATGAVYIVDLDNHALRRLYRGKLETVAGNGSEGRGQLHNPYGVAVCSDGSVLVAHMHRVVLVEDPFGETPITRTLAGSHQEGYVDGSSSHARFTNPCGVAIFPAVGIAVSVCGFSPGEEVAAIADSGNHVIRLVNRKGRVRTLAGNGEKGGIDGNPKSAAFDEPSDISVCPGGKALIVVDTSRLRRISLDPPGVSTLIKFDFLPSGVACAADGAMYVTDPEFHCVRCVRRVHGKWKATIVAGGAGPRQKGHEDGLVPLFHTPCGIDVTPAGDVVLADCDNHCVRRVAVGWQRRLEARGLCMLLGRLWDGEHRDIRACLVEWITGRPAHLTMCDV